MYLMSHFLITKFHTGFSMKWVEVKMKELGVLNNPNYKITALLDHLAMISVQSQSHGVFDCKPLGLIWGKFPEVSFVRHLNFKLLVL